jgi:hypothetical protein
MKYEVGDKVKIREDLIVGNRYGRDDFARGMEKYKGKIATITAVYNYTYHIDIDDNDSIDWHWTDEMFEDCEEKTNTPMTVADLLNKTNVEIGGLIITIYYPNAYFEATIGHNKINRHSELYKRFIEAYGDMTVDEVSFDIRNENMITMLIKVDYAD